MKILASILFILLILLQLQLWFGTHGVFQLWSLQTNIAGQKSSNESLMDRNEQLHAEVQELKNGREALEERARSQLGFIKEGEQFYRLVPNTEVEEN